MYAEQCTNSLKIGRGPCKAMRFQRFDCKVLLHAFGPRFESSPGTSSFSEWNVRHTAGKTTHCRQDDKQPSPPIDRAVLLRCVVGGEPISTTDKTQPYILSTKTKNSEMQRMLMLDQCWHSVCGCNLTSQYSTRYCIAPAVV